MSRNVHDTVAAVFARAVASDPTRPLLTWYDDATGERTELSGATLDNWVAKTANLLVDGAGLGPGERAAVLLPPHWQTAAVLLGCWSAGLVVDLTGADSAAEALFTTAERATGGPVPAAGEQFALGLAPLAAPLRQVPAGFADYVAEVRGHGDRFTPFAEIDAGAAALVGVAHGELCARAHSRAAGLGIARGDRVLVDAEEHPDPLDWLLAPLVAGASVVLCTALDAARLPRRSTEEKVTVRLTGSPG
jgi:uncharacterized protein (TIGR03089 family)